MKTLSGSTITTIKRLFTIGFGAVILLLLLSKALDTLPDQWLFFLTSDAMENFLCACIALLLLYYVLSLKSIWQRAAYLFSFALLLGGLAVLKDYRIHGHMSFDESFGYFTSFLGMALLFYLLLYLVNRLEALNHYTKLKKELNKAQEQLLRNQLHPHFLFNAFNSLYSLSLKNNPDTPDYILKLSSMMRYLTDETPHGPVPIAKELAFIRQYLAVEKLRFGETASIELNVEAANIASLWIEPFLLIPLVENAFKHGFYTNAKDAFVRINLKTQQDELHFSVENRVLSKQHFQETHRKGKGLENLKQRLALLYPKKAWLETKEADSVYRAKLILKLH